MFGGLRELYDAVLERDLKYAFSGGAPLALVLYFEEPVAIDSALHVVSFIACAYLLGIALFHLAITLPTRDCPIVRMYPPGRAFDEQEAAQVQTRIRMRESNVQLRAVDRTLFVKEMNAAVVVAILACAVVSVVYGIARVDKLSSFSKEQWIKLIALCLAGLAIGVSSWKQNRSKASIQGAVFDELAKRVNAPNQPGNETPP